MHFNNFTLQYAISACILCAKALHSFDKTILFRITALWQGTFIHPILKKQLIIKRITRQQTATGLTNKL